MQVIYTAERAGSSWIGEVIDLASQRRVARTGTRYPSAESAKSGAEALWQSMQRQLAEVA